MAESNTVKLVWAGKDTVNPGISADYKLIDFEYVYPNFLNLGEEKEPVNTLIQGNNREVISLLLNAGYKNKLDLIYIDPPYLSKSKYFSRIEVYSKGKKYVLSQEIFEDTWEQNLDNYLTHIYAVLSLMKELLSDRGSIFVHLDWHASHYVKVILDEIFSPDNFINEIVWCYGGGSAGRRHFHRKHDTILWYSKGKDYIFNPQYRPYTEKTRQRGLTRVKGDKYKLNDDGAMMQDWWTDINKILSPTARENLKFPTQKPVELLKRLVKTASLPESIVGDFYAGSGTTIQACEELGRKWIGCDLSPIALQTCMRRMIEGSFSPFKVQYLSGLESRYSADNVIVIKKPEVIKKEDRNYLLKIELENYIPDKKNKEKISFDVSFASLINFWEIDPDYNGKLFSSKVQIYRKRAVFDENINLSSFIDISDNKSGKIAIRIHDVFGDSATLIERIP
ncbi:site-specific DNA-methyltransferase [Thermosyntropha sp.]|uniref:DNA methyltransferase n=1 Tax=Thermosyntropha sp. TaxID=2740820 RepID=UPI0025EDB66B|nr:site-specific DNA-methyltransferase [Thermosyntropha sp.]MBO8159334.1 site-specific DNA-methyltransferase [Thermosyntropha sp.]